MHFSALVNALVAAFVLQGVSAAPTEVVNNIGAGSVGVANVGGGNAQGSNLAGSNVGALAVGTVDRAAGQAPGRIGRLPSTRRRRSPKTKTQPEYINSPQADVSNSCSTGTAQCCQSLHQTQDLRNQGAFGSLLSAGIPLDQLMVGFQCTPIAEVVPVLGGSNTCKSQPVCCSGNKYDGLVSTGCSPIGLV